MYTAGIQTYDHQKPHMKIIREVSHKEPPRPANRGIGKSILYLHMVEHRPARRRSNLQPRTKIGIKVTAIVWIISQAQKNQHSIHETSYTSPVCANRRQDREHPFEGKSMSRRRQEGERQGAGLENSISLLPPPPTRDETQGLLYLDKSSMTKPYPQMTPPPLSETGSHYITQSVPSLTVLLPQPPESQAYQQLFPNSQRYECLSW